MPDKITLVKYSGTQPADPGTDDTDETDNTVTDDTGNTDSGSDTDSGSGGGVEFT